jgi:trehalose 6-phosphate synthase/phosphatase
MTPNEILDVRNRYCVAKKRALLLDFDGTLIPITHSPLSETDFVFRQSLSPLVNDSRNDIVIVSGRPMSDLDRIFKEQRIFLVAEHGAFLRSQGRGWESLLKNELTWKEVLLVELNELLDAYPESSIQNKEFSLVWSYHHVPSTIDLDRIHGKLSRKQHLGFVVYREHQSIELRSVGIDKGEFANQWLVGRSYDFVLAIGDGNTDEDLFRAIGAEGCCIKVGGDDHTAAQFRFNSQDQVIPFLEFLQKPTL